MKIVTHFLYQYKYYQIFYKHSLLKSFSILGLKYFPLRFYPLIMSSNTGSCLLYKSIFQYAMPSESIIVVPFIYVFKCQNGNQNLFSKFLWAPPYSIAYESPKLQVLRAGLLRHYSGGSDEWSVAYASVVL